MKNLRAIIELSQDIIGLQELERSAEILSQRIRDLYGIQYVGLFSVENEQHLSLLHGSGLGKDEITNIKLLSWWEDIANEVLSTRKVVIISGDLARQRFEGGFASALGLPLFSSHGLKGIIVMLCDSDSFCPGDISDELVVMSMPLTAEIVSAELYARLEELFLSTILALASAVDAKHPYTRGHSERVTRYSMAIAQEMEMDKSAFKDLQISALLHDVGKIGISENVLDKNGKLTDDEYDMIKQHPSIGARIVGKIVNSEKIVPGILDHHERYDGKGYPNGKKGEEISLFGRIIAVADTFDAMTSTRAYRKALPFQIAVEEIVYNSGYQFDPKIVKFFVQAYEKNKDIWQRENIIYSAI